MNNTNFFSLLGVTGGLILIILLMELFVRGIHAAPKGNFIWEPSQTFVFPTDQYHINGVSGKSYFRTNQLGGRGHDIPDVNVRKMVVLGGSTVECRALDQGEAWPQLLQEELFAELKEPTWVGNFGKSNLSSQHFLLKAETLIDQPLLSDLDVILVLPGLQDVINYMENAQPQVELPRKNLIKQTFSQHEDLSWVENLSVKKRFQQWFYDPDIEEISIIPKWERKANDAAIAASLNQFQDKLETLWQSMGAEGIKTIFITQPIGWTDSQFSLLAAEANYIKPGAKASEQAKADFAAHVQYFNDRLREMCFKQGIPMIDLDRLIPKTKRLFYDDYHFTEYGARFAAQIIAEYLAETNLFE